MSDGHAREGDSRPLGTLRSSTAISSSNAMVGVVLCAFFDTIPTSLCGSNLP